MKESTLVVMVIGMCLLQVHRLSDTLTIIWELFQKFAGLRHPGKITIIACSAAGHGTVPSQHSVEVPTMWYSVIIALRASLQIALHQLLTPGTSSHHLLLLHGYAIMIQILTDNHCNVSFNVDQTLNCRQEIITSQHTHVHFTAASCTTSSAYFIIKKGSSN